MAQITSLLNGENINHDHQITALHKALINPWVISGLTVTTGQVAVGEAFVECTRSNGEKIMVHFQNTAPVNIDTSGNKKIFVEIKQTNIDNGINNAEDGSNIAEIKSGANYPTKNFIPLASVSGGNITDVRGIITLKNIFRKWLTPNGFLVVENGVEKITTGLPTSVIASVFNARAITELAENHEFLLRKWNATEKINYPNFRNNLVKKFAKNPTSIPSADEYWNGDHWWNVIAVPNGGFFSLTAAKGSSSSGSTHLMYSATNDSNKSRWENVASVSASRPGDQWILGTTSGFCKPGFYRKKIYNQGYSGDDSVATIQIF